MTILIAKKNKNYSTYLLGSALPLFIFNNKKYCIGKKPLYWPSWLTVVYLKNMWSWIIVLVTTTGLDYIELLITIKLHKNQEILQTQRLKINFTFVSILSREFFIGIYSRRVMIFVNNAYTNSNRNSSLELEFWEINKFGSITFKFITYYYLSWKITSFQLQITTFNFNLSILL